MRRENLQFRWEQRKEGNPRGWNRGRVIRYEWRRSLATLEARSGSRANNKREVENNKRKELIIKAKNTELMNFDSNVFYHTSYEQISMLSSSRRSLDRLTVFGYYYSMRDHVVPIAAAVAAVIHFDYT